MGFSPIVEKKAVLTRKTEYLELVPGNSVIRIIDEDYYSVETHFINKMSVVCLGEDCPVCKNNRRLILDNPDTFRPRHE